MPKSSIPSTSVPVARHGSSGAPFTFPSPLYVIIDPDILGQRSCEDVTRAALAGGARLVQLRVKGRSSREFLALARSLRALTRSSDATLVINDRADVALAVEADAVHVGADDLPVSTLRQMVGNALHIGGTAHSLDEAREAEASGADYIGFGPMYATSTKVVDHDPQGLDALRAVRAAISIPIVAIGGITEERASAVLLAGADAVAMISEIARASNVEEKVARLIRSMAPEGGR